MAQPEACPPLALFGGTFNPPHLGHRALLLRHHEAYPAHRVVLLPCHRPPHKAFEPGVPDHERLSLTRLLVEGLPWVRVDDLELRQPGVSYTIDTVRHFERQDRAPLPIQVLLGDDLAESLPSWKSWPDLAALVHWVCFTRQGLGAEARARVEAGMREGLPPGLTPRLTWLDMPPYPASSTELRKRLAARAPGTRAFFTEAQWRHLCLGRLYGAMLE